MTRATDIERRASEWLIRSERGDFTEAMRSELNLWLEEPHHRVPFLRIQEAWRRANRVRGARPLDGNVDPDLLKRTNVTSGPSGSRGGPKRGSGWSVRIALAAAASLIIYLAVLIGCVVLTSNDWIPYTTTVGGYEHIKLSDGSGIQLNTDSVVEARLTGQKREVKLIRGEALFTVASDVHRPFTISVGDASLRAEPTAGQTVAFVIRKLTSTNVDVAVTEGSVSLGPSLPVIDVALGRNPEFQSAVGAGYAASVRPEGIHLMRVSLQELNRKLTWDPAQRMFLKDEEANRMRGRLIVSRGAWKRWLPACSSRQKGDPPSATDTDIRTSTGAAAHGTCCHPRQPDAEPGCPSGVRCAADLEVGAGEAGRHREGPFLDCVSRRRSPARNWRSQAARTRSSRWRRC